MKRNDVTEQAEGEPSSARIEQPTARFRYRIRFGKEAGLRFISHQDLLRTFERLLRRTNLPLRFSQGFNAKPKLSSPLSLALGISATEEVLDVELTQRFEESEVARLLEAETVPGLRICRVVLLPANQKMAPVISVEYTCVFQGGFSESEVAARREDILSATSWVIERKAPGKPVRRVDIRPKIDGIAITGNEIKLLLRVENGSTVRPEEALSALGLGEIVRDGRVAVTRSRVELDEPADDLDPGHRSRQEESIPAV